MLDLERCSRSKSMELRLGPEGGWRGVINSPARTKGCPEMNRIAGTEISILARCFLEGIGVCSGFL